MNFSKLFKLSLLRLKVAMGTPPSTVEYPAVYRQPPHGARVAIRNHLSECIGCHDCEKKCPVQCISIVSEDFPSKDKIPTTSKGVVFEKKVVSYKIDYNSCVNCGVCVDICPTNALSFDKNFTAPRFKSALLILDQVHRPRSLRNEQGFE